MRIEVQAVHATLQWGENRQEDAHEERRYLVVDARTIRGRDPEDRSRRRARREADALDSPGPAVSKCVGRAVAAAQGSFKNNRSD